MYPIFYSDMSGFILNVFHANDVAYKAIMNNHNNFNKTELLTFKYIKRIVKKNKIRTLILILHI